MAQIGDGPEPQGNVPHVLTFGAPTVGEILAERYQLEDHIGTDSLGRQLWRGGAGCDESDRYRRVSIFGE